MNKVQRIKQLIAEHPRLFRIFCWSINHFPFRNHVHIRKGNSLLCNESILTHCRISVEGIGNMPIQIGVSMLVGVWYVGVFLDIVHKKLIKIFL